MIKLRKANVIIRASENELNKYLARGFDVISEDGEVIKRSAPNDTNSLKKAYTEHIEEIKKLTAEIESLKAEIEALKAKPKAGRKKKSEE